MVVPLIITLSTVKVVKVPKDVILGCAAVDKTPVIDSKEPNNPVMVPLALMLPEAVIWDKVFINPLALTLPKVSINALTTPLVAIVNAVLEKVHDVWLGRMNVVVLIFSFFELFSSVVFEVCAYISSLL